MLCFVATPALAANTSGYAWSESIGWFDFSPATVSNTTLTGNAYNDNTGWLVLDGITNTNGTLSGYAWSESVGYFDFSNVRIINGAFSGYAYNDNTGWLSFEDKSSVNTTWTIAVPETNTHTALGTSLERRIKNLIEMGQIKEADELKKQYNIPLATVVNKPITKERDLFFGLIGEDVRVLQKFLNNNGFIIATTGSGSPGKETGKFGVLTKKAVIKFQKKNKIIPAIGYCGPKTKAFIKKLISNN